MRWATTGDAAPGLFAVEDLVTPVAGTGRMSGLEFLHVTAKRILNHVPDGSRAPTNWTINVYRGCSHACSYCFARPTHEYLGLNLGDDFDRRIVVKINAVERLRAELADPAWRRDPVAMGTNTDPYQRAEAKYRLTRGVLEALTEHATPFSILTKSPLVTRDLDVLRTANECTDVSVGFSIGTLDQRVWRASEPGSPNPRRRVAAMAALTAAGIRTGALVAPVLPGLSDDPRQLREVVTAIDDAGGRLLGIGALYLRPGVREHFLDWLRGAFPDQYDSYLRRYDGRAYAPAHYGEQLYARAGLSGRARPGRLPGRR
ncbi:DNA repair photolyase [Jatrophihabitans endophyticus]|uniref:DNA repair photolyase n=1 Tax=Jatrophihabitans endophyticus TaxID=1206085 RepID=A0A1M5UG55_9ACTN|nr:radical SAM protein [Jatrophihabitans endophyticus]SHH62032.1 DNA repair photolyase [Jatrophihabitans endophyticus]